MKRHADGVGRSHGITIRIRVGLNSGEVVVRAIGSDLHMDYTAVGQTTHLAARMEQLAAPGTTLLTSASLALSEDFIQVKSLGPRQVKGLSEPIEVYELLGASPVRSRFHAHATRGLTTFVGRTIEMAELTTALDLARSGRGQLVAVVGEPGVGKSRVFWEFAHSHRAGGCLVLEAASVSYGKAITYLPIIELLRRYFQIEPRDEVRKIREKVSGKLLSLDQTLEPALPPLLALLDVPINDAEWTGLDPPQRRQRTLGAVKCLLLRESQVQPLVLIFEDLHWIDRESQAALEGLVESLPAARVLLLVNYRPEFQHAWGAKTYYRQLRIDALSVASAEELLSAMLGTDSSLERLKQLLMRRTEGNPFFLEESVRTLVETKALAGHAGAYRLTTAPESLEIPATTQAILAARIDRLEPEDKRLLQTASVVGKDVPFPLLEAIADVEDQELRHRLARLQTVLRDPSLPGARVHLQTCADPRGHVWSAVAGPATGPARTPGRRDRESAFRSPGRACGTTSPPRGPWRREGEGDAVSPAVRPQGGGTIVTPRGRGSFEHALNVLRTLPEDRATMEQAFETRLELRSVLIPLGEGRRVLECLEGAAALAERLNDDRRRGLTCAFLAHAHTLRGELDDAVASGTRGLAIARGLGDLELRILTTSFLLQAYSYRGEFERAVELARDNLATAPVDIALEDAGGARVLVAVRDRAFLIRSLAHLGRFAEATDDEATAIRLAERTHHALSIGLACFGAVPLHLLKGEWAEAHSLVEHYIDTARRGNVVLQLPGPITSSAWALAELGQVTPAVTRLREGEELLENQAAKGLFLNHAWGYYSLGRAALRLDRLDESRRLGSHALESPSVPPGFAAYALHLLGEISTQSSRFGPERAEAYYCEALALAEPRGMRPLVAHCHLGLGKLYQRTGDRAKADEHLTTATTMYREMGMAFWLTKGRAGSDGIGLMRCPQCGHENDKGTKFCGECGARLAARCASCGPSNPPSNKFCGECGASLAQEVGVQRFASPERYPPKHLAEKILTSKSALEGELEFVTAARALGGTDRLVVTRHILPNSLPPLIVQTTLAIAFAILQAAALGFLGLGAQPPTPEWGAMLADSYKDFTSGAWWVFFFPGAAIMLSVLGFNLRGDGLRDALDPRLRSD